MSFESEAGAIKIRIVADDGFSNTFDKATQKSKEAKASLGAVGTAADGLVRQLGGLALAYIGVRGAIESFTTALDEAKEAAQGEIFEKLGGDIDALRGKLGGMVTGDDVVRIGAYAKSLGLTDDQIGQLAETAEMTARVMGVDTAKAFESLASGVATGNARLLRQAGLLIDVEQANNTFAKSIGTTGDKLNEAGQQMAMFNAVMEQQADLQDKLSDVSTDNAHKLEGFKTAVEELADAFTSALVPGAVAVVEKLQPMVETVTDLISELGVARGLLTAFAIASGADVDYKTPAEREAERQADNEAADMDAFGFSIGEAKVTSVPKRSKYVKDTTAEEARKAAQHLTDLGNALRDFAAAAREAEASTVAAPFEAIYNEQTKAVEEFAQKFGDVATFDQIAQAWTDASTAALGKAQAQMSSMIDSGVISSMDQIEEAARAAGFTSGDFADQVAQLGHVFDLARLDAQALANSRAWDDMFRDPVVPRDLEHQLLGMLPRMEVGAGGFEALSMGAAGASGLMTGGLSGMGTAIGMAAGGPIGAAAGGALVSAAETAGNIMGDAVAVIFRDQRFGSTLGAAGSGGYMAALGAGALGGMIAPAGGLLGPLLGPVGAAAGAFLALTTGTKSYERVQAGMSLVLDKVTGTFEGFWENGSALVGIVGVMGDQFSRVMAPFAQNEAVFRIMFEVVKGTGLVLGGLGFVSAAVYDGFVQVAGAGAYLATLFKTGFNVEEAEAAYTAITEGWGINLDTLGEALATLADTTYTEARAFGDELIDAAESAGESSDALNKLTDSVLNGPVGFAVERYRYGAQIPSPNDGGPGDMRSTPIPWANMFNVEGDLIINEGAISDQETLEDALQESMERTAGQNNGNPQSGGRRGYNWRDIGRGGRRGRGR